MPLPMKSPPRGAVSLNLIALLDDHTVSDRSGAVAAKLADELGVERQTISSALLNYKGYKFIETETRGRKTYRAWITEAGRSWVRTHQDRVTWTPITTGPKPLSEMRFDPPPDDELVLPEAPNGNGDGSRHSPQLSALLNGPKALDDDASLPAGRTGRVAARLEKTMPEIVEKAVQDALSAAVLGFATRLGLSDPAPLQARIDELEADMTRGADLVATLSEELRVERQLGEHAREQLNTVLAKSDEGRVRNNESKLKPSDLDESWRELAAEFLDQGGTLARTRGGHVLWRWPDGRRAFGPSTSSDYRAVRNMRSDLRKVTGFRDGKGAA